MAAPSQILSDCTYMWDNVAVGDGATEVEAAASRRTHPLSYPEAGVDVAPQHLAGLVTAVPKVNESAGAWSV